MTALLWVHIAGGMVALAAGVTAVATRKGGPLHALSGTWFFGSMLLLGVTAAILSPFKTPPESPIGGLLVCYFVLTSWVTARRRDGSTGVFEIIACLAVVTGGGLTVWGALTGAATTPVGAGPLFAFAGVNLLAGLLDLNAILRARLSPTQRIARHLWRMCFAFFIATGSFFIGQQDVMPAAVRGSPVLLVLGFAPLPLMVFWLLRVWLGKRLRQGFEALGASRRVAA